MAHSKPDPEFNPYSAPESDFESDQGADGPDLREFVGGTNYAKFSQRLYAFLLDWLIIYGLMWMVNIGVAIFVIAILSWDLQALIMGTIFRIFIMAMPLFYFVLQEGSNHQATFGKRIMGIKVTSLEGSRVGFWQATTRNLCKIPSAIFLFLGFLLQPFTAKRQALHDILSGTVVIETRS